MKFSSGLQLGIAHELDAYPNISLQTSLSENLSPNISSKHVSKGQFLVIYLSQLSLRLVSLLTQPEQKLSTYLFFSSNKLLFTVCIEPFVMTALPFSMYAALNFIFPFSFPERLPQIHRRGYCSRKLFKRLNLCVKLIIILLRGQLNLTTYNIR